MGRTGERPVNYAEAVRRLLADRESKPDRLYSTASLAETIWPNNRFLNRQGAALAVGAILKRLRTDGIAVTDQGGQLWRLKRPVRSAANR